MNQNIFDWLNAVHNEEGMQKGTGLLLAPLSVQQPEPEKEIPESLKWLRGAGKVHAPTPTLDDYDTTDNAQNVFAASYDTGRNDDTTTATHDAPQPRHDDSYSTAENAHDVFGAHDDANRFLVGWVLERSG